MTKITLNTALAGYNVGDTIDRPDSIAEYLIENGHAEPATKSAPAPKGSKAKPLGGTPEADSGITAG